MTILPDKQPAERATGRHDGWWMTALWLGVCLVVGTGGEFPLNDDWSYQLTVRTLVEQGQFHPCGWTSMPLLTHVLWGALFCLPFGVSAVALRVSTLVMALLAMLATRALLREVGAGRGASTLGTLTVASCPLFVALAFTFMTDVPFAALSTTALWLYAKSLRTKSPGLAALATTVMLAATLNRQVGLFVAVGYAAALLHRDGLRLPTLLRASVPLLLAGAMLLGLQLTLEAFDALPSEYLIKNRSALAAFAAPGRMLAMVAESAFVSLAYLGLFLLPITLTNGSAPAPRLARLAGIACTASMGAMLLWRQRTMPLGFNTVMPTGIGPDLLRDVYLLQNDNLPPLPGPFWLVVTMLSVLGAGLLVTRVLTMLPSLRRPRSGAVKPVVSARVLLLAATCAGLLPVLVQQPLDRYLIPLVPCLAAALLAGGRPATGHTVVRRATGTLAWTWLISIGAFSVVGTRDWLERGRARWQALDWLETTRGVTWRETDGGFEYQGLRGYDPEYRATATKSWWWVHDDRFVVAMGPLPGYRQVHAVAVPNWLGAPQQVVVLERER